MMQHFPFDEETKNRIATEFYSFNDTINEELPSEEAVAAMQADFEKSGEQERERAIASFKRALYEREEAVKAEIEQEIQPEIDRNRNYLKTQEGLLEHYEKELSELGALNIFKKKACKEKIEEKTAAIERIKEDIASCEKEYSEKVEEVSSAIKEQIENASKIAAPLSPFQNYIAQKYIAENWPTAWENAISRGGNLKADKLGAKCCVFAALKIMGCAVTVPQMEEAMQYIKDQAPIFNAPDILHQGTPWISSQYVSNVFRELEKEELIERFIVDEKAHFIIKDAKR